MKRGRIFLTATVRITGMGSKKPETLLLNCVIDGGAYVGDYLFFGQAPTLHSDTCESVC